MKLESTVNALTCVNEWDEVSKNKSAGWLEKEIYIVSGASSQDQQVLDIVHLNQWKMRQQLKKLTTFLTKVSEILSIPLHVSNYNLPYNSQHSLNAQSSWSDRSSSTAAVRRPELTKYDIQVCWSCYQMTVPLQPGEGRWNALHIPMGNTYKAGTSWLQKNVLDTHT